jgi:hypothetical protein
MKRKFISVLTSFAMVSLLLLSPLLHVNAATPTLEAVPGTVDGNHWWVGDVTVGLPGGNAFTVTTNTAAASNVAWEFTYAQLKEMNDFNITINNDEALADSPYLKLFFTVGSVFVFVDPFKSAVDNWVRASAHQGLTTLDLLTAVDTAVGAPITDDTVVYMFLYVDGSLSSVKTLDVQGISLTGEEPAATPTDGPDIVYEAVPGTVDGNNWWVGDVTVGLPGGNAFTVTTNTAAASNIAWEFTYAQLKTTDTFNITINNDEALADSPYLKLFFTVGSVFVFVDPFKSAVDNWVRASAHQGLTTLDLLTAVDTAVGAPITDDTVVYMFLYVDGSLSSVKTLDVQGISLTGESVPTPTEAAATPTEAAATPTEAAATPTEAAATPTEEPAATPTVEPVPVTELHAIPGTIDANHWWVGTNINVGVKTGSGFTIASKNGTAAAANIAWDFTYGELKELNYFNIDINNTEAADTSPYIKLYFLIGSTYVYVDPFTSTAENWIRASTVSGLNTVDLYSKVNDTLSSIPADDTWCGMFLWIDPSMSTVTTLDVESLYLSQEIPTTPTGIPNATPTDVPDENPTTGDPMNTSMMVFVVLTVLVGSAVLLKKKFAR